MKHLLVIYIIVVGLIAFMFINNDTIDDKTAAEFEYRYQN